MEPISSRVVVLPDQAETETDAGIIIPDMAVEKPKEGEIVAVGPETKQCKVGDRVLFTKFAGNEANLPGFDRPVLIMREGDILVRIPA